MYIMVGRFFRLYFSITSYWFIVLGRFFSCFILTGDTKKRLGVMWHEMGWEGEGRVGWGGGKGEEGEGRGGRERGS